MINQKSISAYDDDQIQNTNLLSKEIYSNKLKKSASFRKVFNFVKQNFLLFSLIISVFFAITTGLILRKFFKFNHNQINYFGFVGQIFLRLIKLLIMPLIAFRYYFFFKNKKL